MSDQAAAGLVRCECCGGEYLFHVDNAGRRYVIINEFSPNVAMVRYLSPGMNECPCRRRFWGRVRAHLGGCRRQRVRHIGQADG